MGHLQILEHSHDIFHTWLKQFVGMLYVIIQLIHSTHHGVCYAQYMIDRIKSLDNNKETLPKLSGIKNVSKKPKLLVVHQYGVPGASLQCSLQPEEMEEL
jgi:hypothetical protein